MTNHVPGKPIVIAKEHKILTEFTNSATPGAYQVLSCEVVSVEQSKTDLSKYSVILSTDDLKIEMPAETFLYQLTSTKRTKLNENVKYRRNNIWEVEFFPNNSPTSIKIEFFDEVIQAVYSILKKSFKFFSEIFETYEYLHLIPLFKVYKKSYDNPEEACEKFYEMLNNKLKTSSLEEFIEVCEEIQSDHNLSQFQKSKPTAAAEKKDDDICEICDICERFIRCAEYAIPHHFSCYVLTEYFTDDQIYDCYGGKEKAVEYLERVLGEHVSFESDEPIMMLKKLTFDKDNKQFDNRAYIKHLVETIENKGKEYFPKRKKEWRSHSNMIYDTVSRIMWHEKDKTTI